MYTTLRQASVKFMRFRKIDQFREFFEEGGIKLKVHKNNMTTQ